MAAYKFIEMKSSLNKKIPLFFINKYKNSKEDIENYRKQIKLLENRKWDGKRGKLEEFILKLNLKLKMNFGIPGKFKIEIYESEKLTFSIIESEKDEERNISELQNENVIEYLIHQEENKTIYYILSRNNNGKFSF